MSVTSGDLKSLAERLCHAEASEVDLRTSISRAYYAAFHDVLHVAAQLPESAESPRDAEHISHREAGLRLREWRVPDDARQLKRLAHTAKGLQGALQTARIIRVIADYRLDSTCSLEEAKQQIARVRIIRMKASQLAGAMGASRSDDVARQG